MSEGDLKSADNLEFWILATIKAILNADHKENMKCFKSFLRVNPLARKEQWLKWSIM